MNIDDDGLAPIATSCMNCGRESHFLGVFCWWGIGVVVCALIVALVLPLIAWVSS